MREPYVRKCVLNLRVDQIASLAHKMATPFTLDLSDPGTGKTPPVCVNQYRRLTEGKRTIWVQPKSLMAKNARELQRFTPLVEKDITIIDGTPKQVEAAMLSGAGVFMCGPDRFRKIQQHLPSDVTAIDVDELHMCFGNHNSARTNSGFYPAMEKMKEGVFMTGTLINGRLDTAYPAIHAINPCYYPFGYDEFLGAHAELDDYGRPFKWHGHERLKNILLRHGYRRTFESIFGPQEVVMRMEWLGMSPKQQAIYEEFEREAILELENFMIDGTLPGVATIRARQIMEHPNFFPDLRDPDNLPRVDIMPGERPAKLDALEIHFEDHKRLGTPVIVFHPLIASIKQIAALAESMGLRTATLYGETKNRDQLDLAYQRGEIDVLVASPPVASVGYNWQFAGQLETDHVIFSGLTYMDSDYVQGYRRAIRQNRSKALRITVQGYLNTIDTNIMAINERKSRDANKVEPTREVLKFLGI